MGRQTECQRILRSKCEWQVDLLIPRRKHSNQLSRPGIQTYLILVLKFEVAFNNPDTLSAILGVVPINLLKCRFDIDIGIYPLLLSVHLGQYCTSYKHSENSKQHHL